MRRVHELQERSQGRTRMGQAKDPIVQVFSGANYKSLMSLRVEQGAEERSRTPSLETLQQSACSGVTGLPVGPA